ncbi:MAG: hypothetical protein WBG70_17080 [Spirulinaceae cyanobacterium]
MNFLKGLIVSTLVVGSILLAPTANAETYRAGNFIITIEGSTYTGCDSNGNCITLDNYQKWQHNGQRGIAWENGDYVYSVSWQEGIDGMYLKVSRGDEVLVSEKMEYLGY